jgi:hypothetical protein
VFALAVSFTPLVGYYFFVVGRQFGVSFRALAADGMRSGVAAAAMALALVGLRLQNPLETGPFRLAVLVMVGALVYVSVLFLVRGVTPAEVLALRRAVRRRRTDTS